jgi:hypothetical protein
VFCLQDGNAELTEDGPAFEPLRRICAVASGGFVSPVRSDGGASVQGAVLCVGGEVVGAGMDPARAVPFKVSSGGAERGIKSFTRTHSCVGTLGTRVGTLVRARGSRCVTDVAAVVRSGAGRGADHAGGTTGVRRTAACVLSEGGQIHVHDLRSLGCNPVLTPAI